MSKASSCSLILQNDIESYTFDYLVPPLLHQIDSLLASPPFKPFGREDARVIALVRWYKGSYMSWIDPIKCPLCRGKTELAALVEPTAEERKDASRVELHRCVDEGCGGSRRFARYIKSSKLLYTREGRCGEQSKGLRERAAPIESRRMGTAVLRISTRRGVESAICLERVGRHVVGVLN